MNRAAICIVPLLLLAACGSEQRQTVRALDQRLQQQLGPDIAAGRASVQGLPDGAQVTLLSSSLFQAGQPALDDRYPDIRAGLIAALLDPTLMRVQVTDSSTLPDDQRMQRVQNVQQYFIDNGLGPTLQAEELAPVVGSQPGLNVRIAVVCPPRPGIGYGSGMRQPGCF